MVGWHHQLNGHAFEQAPVDGEGQGSLACCSPQGHKESDTTERLNNRFNPGQRTRFHMRQTKTLHVAKKKKNSCRGKLTLQK